VVDESEAEEEAEEEVAQPPKKRGRPPKKGTATKVANSKKRGREAKGSAAEVEDEEEEETAEPPKKRGRPPKAAATEESVVHNEDNEENEVDEENVNAAEDAEGVEEPAVTPKKRGRPTKASSAKRGRPATKKPAPAVPDEETPPPKQRGSSPHGGETTKMEGDDDAAADQLEDELMDNAVTPQATATVTKKGKAKVTETDKPHDSGKQYWLMKAEQEDRDEAAKSGRIVNTKFTIDDLRSKDAPEPWDGVRNPTAAKNMRAMKVGDLAFFYASGGKQGRKPGIVGIMEVVKEAEIDRTVYDEDSLGFVEKEKDRERWVAVHVEYRKKLTKPVYLSTLQKFKEGGGVLSNMQELVAARLSVSKVSEKEWTFITENLVEGYEEDDAPPDRKTSPAIELEDTPIGDIASENTKAEKASIAPETVIDKVVETASTLVNGSTLPEMALPTIENASPSSDSAIPAGTSQTSRPTSRASSTKGKAGGSRASSAAKGKGGSSRAGSAGPSAGGLAPPATKGRGRSITPRSRAGSARPAEDAAAMQTIGEE
jgi:predicted RNA-binding protein with PUA-like domain